MCSREKNPISTSFSFDSPATGPPEVDAAAPSSFFVCFFSSASTRQRVPNQTNIFFSRNFRPRRTDAGASSVGPPPQTNRTEQHKEKKKEQKTIPTESVGRRKTYGANKETNDVDSTSTRPIHLAASPIGSPRSAGRRERGARTRTATTSTTSTTTTTTTTTSSDTTQNTGKEWVFSLSLSLSLSLCF